MRGIKFLSLIILFLSAAFNTGAQSDSVALDSANNVFTYDEFLLNVSAYHPLAQKAELRLRLGEAEWLKAKGNFDPVLSSAWSQKNFDDKLYYQQFSSKLKVPTRLGIDLVAGYENTTGVFLNPENNTDQYGLWNLGVEVNLLQGLLVDERRAALKQARIFMDMAQNQRQILLNELLFNASMAYLEWQQYYFNGIVFRENLDIASTYFNNVKSSFTNGESMAIDTLEAYIALQDANVMLLSNEAALIKVTQQLNNYLWFNGTPLELQDDIIPESYDKDLFGVLPFNDPGEFVLMHPEILENRNKIKYFEVEQRLKRDKLKPKLKAKYNPLLATSENNISPNYAIENFKLGFDFSIPLFLRSERADIRTGEIKLEELGFDLQNKQNILLNKIRANLAEQSVFRDQLALQVNNVEGYRRLLEAENQRFIYGESSVFLLNKRQEKYVGGRLKLIELNTKYQSTLLKYLYIINGLLKDTTLVNPSDR